MAETLPAAAAEEPTPAAAAEPSERAVLVTVALATMLAPLNSTMIAVALPRIIDDFGTDIATAGWLVTAYLIVMASIQPVAGKLGDRLGRRRLILGGLVYFGLASVGAAFAPSLPVLLFFRVQQAIAGAIALPNGAALIREVVPSERRASRFGLVGAAISLAAAVGPPLGAFVAEAAGWRMIFLTNVPLVLGALALGWYAVRARRPPPTEHAFDAGGALALSALLVGAAAVLTQRHRFDSALVALAATLLVAGAALFWRHERRHPDPVIRPAFFRRRAFAAANASVALSNLAMYSTLLALPIFLARQPGWSSAAIGTALAALSAATVVCSPFGGRLADRIGRRWTSVAGSALLTLGAVPLALGLEQLSFPALLCALGVSGVGLGLSAAPMQTSAVEAVEARESGVASGVYSTSRYLGSIVGSIMLGALLGAGGGLEGFDALFLVVLLAAAASVVTSLALPDRPRAA